MKRSIDELFAKYNERLVRYLKTIRVSNGDLEADARDLASRTLTAVWQKLDNYSSDAEWAYIRTTAHNLALNERAKWKTRDSFSDLLEEGADASDENTLSAEDAWIRREETRRVQNEMKQALAAMPEVRRLAFLLDGRGFTGAEIAKQLGIHPVTVRVHLLRARAFVRKRVRPAEVEIDGGEVIEGVFDGQQ